MINACGLIGSKRNKSDGCTIIGSQELNQNNELVNDFVISSVDTGIGKRHMVIKYNMDNRQYYLRDLGDGSGTFVKIDVPLVRIQFVSFVASCLNMVILSRLEILTWLCNFIKTINLAR